MHQSHVPTGCLHFGTKDDMRVLANSRAKQLQEHSNFPHAGVYDPPGVGGTGVMYVLHDIDQARNLWRIARRSAHTVVREIVEASAEVAGKSSPWSAESIGVFVHYLRFGPKDRDVE